MAQMDQMERVQNLERDMAAIVDKLEQADTDGNKVELDILMKQFEPLWREHIRIKTTVSNEVLDDLHQAEELDDCVEEAIKSKNQYSIRYANSKLHNHLDDMEKRKVESSLYKRYISFYERKDEIDDEEEPDPCKVCRYPWCDTCDESEYEELEYNSDEEFNDQYLQNFESDDDYADNYYF